MAHGENAKQNGNKRREFPSYDPRSKKPGRDRFWKALRARINRRKAKEYTNERS